MTMVRSLPAITDDNRAFWTGGEQGVLLIHRCQACRGYVHPPVPFCPACEGRDVVPEAVSGYGRVATYSVNYRQWQPDMPVPYVLALVELDEDPTIRIPTNIVGIDPEQVTIDMPVQVTFEQAQDLFVPLFRPVEGAQS
ncbi:MULTISPECIES: Zn-ribbon domain-containing OB-fold protein [unclassified Sphingobium]|uniref:Zn-ribbon domain-containing OB-fold protein n=1 Tax=unclassified Sphingobium TaxID=2611147 RepID=UPI0035A6E074